MLANDDGMLHFRIFDGDGNASVDSDETLVPDQARRIADLKRRLVRLWAGRKLSAGRKRRLIRSAASIFGYSLPRHWIFLLLGRLAIVVAAFFYVVVVFLAQYTSWGGASSLYEQHAFLLPVPFFNM